MINEQDDATYFARPELSQSGCKVLLLPGGPARFKWQQTHPREHKRAFDVGHAAHMLALGVGAEVAVYPDEVLGANGAASTKAAREFAAEARAAGKTLLKPDDWTRVQDMAAVLEASPHIMEVLRAPGARFEVALDGELDGVPFRGKLDQTTDVGGVDVKTTEAILDADSWGRQVYRYCYDVQAAAYVWLMRVNGWKNPDFVHVVQESRAPYLPALYRLDDMYLDHGFERLRRALDIYRECTETGIWPGHPNTITDVFLPAWLMDDDIEIAS